jgi:hypothetical protein
VSLHCRRASALDVARLLYPLGHCPHLKVLDVTLPVPAVLHDVCVVCAARPSIERLAVSFALGGHRYTNDAFPLLTYCRDFPDSLKSLSLRNCLLRLSEVRTGRVAVRKVTSLELVSCDGAPPCLVLERFPNLERLHMGAEDDVIEDGRIPYMIQDAELDKFAQALPLTKVNALSLHVRPWEDLPSLVALLQNARGSINLTCHYFDRTLADNVRRGLEAMNPEVKRLGLRFVESCEDDAGYARFLQVFMGGGRPAALQNLTVELDPLVRDLRHTCDALRTMLPSSRSLHVLEILQVRPSAYESVVESCLAGLAQNRALRTLRVEPWRLSNDDNGEFAVSAAVVSRLHEVLQSNGALGEFNGGHLDLSDPLVRKVHFLLKQNRLGRSVLLEAAAPAGLWPHVLSLVSKACAMDVMFHYLRAAEAGILCRRPHRGGCHPRTHHRPISNELRPPTPKRPRSDSPSSRETAASTALGA